MFYSSFIDLIPYLLHLEESVISSNYVYGPMKL